MKSFFSVIFSLSCAAGAAHAHQIWIEQPSGGNAIIRFGEFGENLREASPGLLDKFVRPDATLLSIQGEKSAVGGKTSSGFILPFKAGAGESIVAEEANYPLYSSRHGEQTMTNWYRPAARFITGFSQQSPRLILDLVPAGQSGTFRLTLHGKTLPKTKVTLVTQSGWSREAHTDGAGMVKFDMPWKGVYVAEVSYNERMAGVRVGARGSEPYDGTNYVTTVTYVKLEGAEPVPAGAVTPPYAGQ